tara:strand:- start:527 stop:781 length:255 start_codon:yes stop_codon:yes gene_type:complete
MNSHEFIKQYIKTEIYRCLKDKEYRSVFLYSLFNNTTLEELSSIIKEYWIDETKLSKVLYKNICISNHFHLNYPQSNKTFNFRV